MFDNIVKFADEHILSAQTASIKPEDIIVYKNKPISSVYSLVARPSQSVREKLAEALDKIKSDDLSLYEYSPSTQYHFTVIGDIPESYDPKKLTAMIEDVLRGCSLSPTYKGLHINLQGICTGVYFEHNEIEKIRADFRRIDNSLIDYNSFLPDLNKIGWLNIARFTEPFTPELKQCVLAEQETVFGSDKIDHLELYLTTSKVLAPESSELISAFSI